MRGWRFRPDAVAAAQDRQWWVGQPTRRVRGELDCIGPLPVEARSAAGRGAANSGAAAL